MMDPNIPRKIPYSWVRHENLSVSNGDNSAVNVMTKSVSEPDTSNCIRRHHSVKLPTVQVESGEGSSTHAQQRSDYSDFPYNPYLSGFPYNPRFRFERITRERKEHLEEEKKLTEKKLKEMKFLNLPNSREDLSSAGSDTEFDNSDSESDYSSWTDDPKPPQLNHDMTRGRIEQIDRLYAQALQFREMQAQNLDLMNDSDLDTPVWPLFDDMLQFDTLDLSDAEDSEDAAIQETPPYPVGRKSQVECAICAEMQPLWLRLCCDLPVCSDCLTQYLTTQVNQANVRIECPSGSCNSYIHRDEVLAVLDSKTKEKYYRFLVDANQEPHIKSCPRCNFILTLSKDEVKTFRFLPKGYKVECSSCKLFWCFPCQAPWHENIKCRDFRKGDKLLKDWSKKYRSGQQNAQRCPKCKVYIQRATGCDHMICSRCSTNFCYRCGERFRHIKFIGDHYSRLSVFGCRYRFMPERPVKRKLIRGAIFGGKLLAAPVVAGLAVGGAALVIGFGTIVAPFYGGYKLHKHLKLRKRLRQRQAANQNGQYGQFIFNGTTFSQYYENLLYENAVLRHEEDHRTTENITLMRPQANSLNPLRPNFIPSHHFVRLGSPQSRHTHTDELTQVTAHAQSDDDRLTVTTTEVTRQQSTSGNNNNYTELDYPMEVLKVVTNYDISTASPVVEANSNNSTRTPRTRKTRKTSRTQALKSSEKAANGFEVGSPKTTPFDTQSDQENFTPARGKTKDKLDNKGIFSVDLEKTYSEDETLSKDPNNSTKNISKDSENKNSSHMPWINIVCGKINRDKDSEKEDAERKTNAAEAVSKQSNRKTCPPLPTYLDCNLKALQRHGGEPTSYFEHNAPKQDNLGAFGSCSDEDDDWSMSSTNQSPVYETKSYYEPADYNLDYIDDFVSEYSEMTSL